MGCAICFRPFEEPAGDCPNEHHRNYVAPETQGESYVPERLLIAMRQERDRLREALEQLLALTDFLRLHPEPAFKAAVEKARSALAAHA